MSTEEETEETTSGKKKNDVFLKRLKIEWFVIAILLLLIIIGGIYSYRTIAAKDKIIKEAEEAARIVEDERVRLASIKTSMERMIEEEADYLQLTSSNTADQTTKDNASLLYKTKSAGLIEEVETKFKQEDYSKFDANLLMNYARHLDMTGNTKKAKELLEYIIGTAKDSITLSYSYGTLANIHSVNGSSYFSPTLSRKYRERIINIAKAAPTGDLRYLKLIDLYEKAAIVEYANFKNKERADKLIDTALFCIGKLPDYSPLKADISQRIRSTYNFYNDILIPENITGNYKFYIDNKGVGDAYITINENQGSIRIDYVSEGKLIGQLNGTGGFVDYGTLKFEVQTESYSNVFNTKKSTSGTLELGSKKGKLLDGVLNEYGKKPVSVKLAKQTE